MNARDISTGMKSQHIFSKDSFQDKNEINFINFKMTFKASRNGT